MTEYQICTNCVMDSSDPKITFNEDGVCDHCIGFEKFVRPLWKPNSAGMLEFKQKVQQVKEKANGKEYDCIMGLSGGLDSSYLLHMAVVEFGLKPLVFHVYGGWNTNIAVSNIEKMVQKLNLELFVEVINWEEMKDFQLALFKSGTPHLDIAQDHAFFGTMFHFARKHKINTILNGGNISTEGIRNPLDWLYYGTDMSFIKDIRRKFGTNSMKTYPWSSIYYHKIYLRYFKKIEVLRPLNFMPYNKSMAIDMLSKEYGWQPYPQKHFESRFTKFYEGYWLPTRFGYDTRRVQFSSLIVTGQMSREEAIQELTLKPYNSDTIHTDIQFIADKLGISVEELNEYHKLPKKWYFNYKNEKNIFNLGAKILQLLGLEFAIKR
ncbi:MAG: N-acetyl sugar amidotransferase [Bacteroidota bacterium]